MTARLGKILSCLLALCYCVHRTLQFAPPKALVEPLMPTGFRIFVPHEDGMTRVAFHIRFDKPFQSVETGTIARDVTKHKRGRWTYHDKKTSLNFGDVVYYWLHVDYKGEGYNLLNQEYVVNDFYDNKGQKLNLMFMNDRLNGCESSATLLYKADGSSSRPCAGALLLDENFRDVNRLNGSLWTIVERFGEQPDFEFVTYRSSRRNVVIDSGLKITPRQLSEEFGDDFVRDGSLTLDRCTGRFKTHECERVARGWNILPPITSGRLDTHKMLNFMYGRVEVRAKLPRGDWIYPHILLESKKYSYAHIRVAASSGNAELTTRMGFDLSGHALWGGVVKLNAQADNHAMQDRTIKRDRDLWSKNFHIYELIWSPSKIILKVDGQMYEEREAKLPNSPFYLTLGVAVGGVTEFPDYSRSNNYTKPWRNVEAKAQYSFYNAASHWAKTWQVGASTMEVDWVKVWAL